jgi:hypothetical protein
VLALEEQVAAADGGAGVEVVVVGSRVKWSHNHEIATDCLYGARIDGGNRMSPEMLISV